MHYINTFFQTIVLRYPKRVLSLLLLLLALVISGYPQFRLDASADSLTLENDKSLDFFRETIQKFGSNDVMVLSYRPLSNQLFDRSELNRLDTFVKQLSDVQGVSSVLAITNLPLLYSPKQSIEQLVAGTKTILDEGVDLQVASEEFFINPYYKGTFVSRDKLTTLVLLNLESNPNYLADARERDELRALTNPTDADKRRIAELDDAIYQMNIVSNQQSKQRVATIEGLMANFGEAAEIHLSGASTIALEMMQYIQNDMQTLGLVAILLVVVLLWLIFRQWQFVVLPIVVCSLCIAVMVGLLGYLQWSVTVISANFIAMLFIINIVVCVHLLVRYREIENNNPKNDTKTNILELVNQMAKPCLFNVITTMVAFTSLIVSDIRPVIDFGLMMALGVLISLFICFLIIPLGLLLTLTKTANLQLKAWLKPNFLLPIVLNKYRIIWAVFTCIVIVSVYGITKLEVENRFIDFFKKDSELVKTMIIIDTELGGTMPFEVVLFPPQYDPTSDETIDASSLSEEDADLFDDDDDLFEDNEFDTATEQNQASNYWWNVAGLQEIDQFHKFLEQQPEIGQVLSVATGYEIAGDLLEGITIDDVVLTVLRNELGEDLQRTLLRPYLNDELNAARVTMRVKESTPNLRRGELIDRIHNYATNEMGWQQEQVHFTGLMELYYNMLISLFRSQILTISMVFFGILLVVTLLFRSLKIALLAVLPNVIASGSILGMMGLIGISLDFMSITIAAITIGIGIDFAIHFIYRYRYELQKGLAIKDAIDKANSSIGQSLSYTTAIITFGFSVFVLSNFIPSIYFGMLISLAMVISLFGTLTLLSSLLAKYKIS